MKIKIILSDLVCVYAFQQFSNSLLLLEQNLIWNEINKLVFFDFYYQSINIADKK